jgi:DNA invertase Pin-like site-specific DNA recombinase
MTVYGYARVSTEGHSTVHWLLCRRVHGVEEVQR